MYSGHCPLSCDKMIFNVFLESSKYLWFCGAIFFLSLKRRKKKENPSDYFLGSKGLL